MRCILAVLLLFYCGLLNAQPVTNTFLKELLEKNTNPVFQQVLRDPQNYRLQIIYTQINRDANNNPSFKNYYFNLDPDLYFNPASTVKLPLSLLSMEKLNDIHIKGV